MDNILEFSADLLAGLRTEQAETDLPLSDLAFERLCGALEGEGEIEALDRVEYAGTALGKTIRIDGTGGDPRDADGILSVIVFEIFETEEPTTIHSADAKRLFGHLLNFVRASLRKEFRDSLHPGDGGGGNSADDCGGLAVGHENQTDPGHERHLQRPY